MPLSELAVGTTAAVTVERVGILLNRTAENTVLAFSAVCTHQGCLVEASFRCPCHGSRFDAATGERLAGPARLPLPAIEVELVDGDIVIA
ncbi:MAG: Rieske (2Fe-2S) protein [Cryobacterium sp.]|nr:Rieske (2Fe-2S) protein [Cryobacterium sp.]